MRPVNWADEARRNLVDIIEYIYTDSPAAAYRVADKIAECASSLSDMPTGRPGRVKGTYEKVVFGLPYILAYVIDEQADGSEVIYLLRVIHGARDWTPDAWPK
ncbi:type II toxin-antitoxin system RelE/ParE family toxin [Asticcacaulis biprosthecium]|uniref:type II toxin-antitoxin system RelE/ParE family toxin n=1 Tax=Asticcacaulis biprosthecium TaxID=76891 RepID=UPI00058D7A7F|nr:type II toxin-antitoxin system RelE/ParE family toxin [Asticcacaulis biprosthecium]